jgi:hypothetical protein
VALAFAPTQAPLVTYGEFYSELNLSRTKQEPELAPYKPHTDVQASTQQLPGVGSPKPFPQTHAKTIP